MKYIPAPQANIARSQIYLMRIVSLHRIDMLYSIDWFHQCRCKSPKAAAQRLSTHFQYNTKGNTCAITQFGHFPIDSRDVSSQTKSAQHVVCKLSYQQQQTRI